MYTTIALSIGSDSLLLASRNLILQAAGCTVLSAVSIREGVNQFLNGDFDLVLLDNSLSNQDQNRLASLIRASGSRTPIVCIASGEEPNSFADETLHGDSNRLLEGIKAVLLKASKTAAAWSGARAEKRLEKQSRKQPSTAQREEEHLQNQSDRPDSFPPFAKAG